VDSNPQFQQQQTYAIDRTATGILFLKAGKKKQPYIKL
jgi:hypothetical protein